MTGGEFKALIAQAGFTQRSLAEHWGISRPPLNRQCQAEMVDQLYVDALKYLILAQHLPALKTLLDQLTEQC